MKIFITGATGFIGRALCEKLVALNYQITAFIRSPQTKNPLPAEIECVTDLNEIRDFSQFNAVINLAGEPIFAKRWTSAQKAKLISSRLDFTQKLVEKINQGTAKPQVFISASATGFYGDKGDEILAETSAIGEGFTAKLCQQWEQIAQQAQCRVCLLRTGIVLAPTGGALAQMLPIYHHSFGGKLGNGEQYWPWISLEDMINTIVFLLETPKYEGAFNCVAPTPITNQQFSQLLAKSLKRPNLASVPAFILKFLLGERASILLDSQRVIPERLIQSGFQFQYPDFANYLKGKKLS